MPESASGGGLVLGGVFVFGPVSAPRGVSAPGGCLVLGVSAPRGVSASGGSVVSQHALRQTPPCEQNDKPE